MRRDNEEPSERSRRIRPHRIRFKKLER